MIVYQHLFHHFKQVFEEARTKFVAKDYEEASRLYKDAFKIVKVSEPYIVDFINKNPEY